MITAEMFFFSTLSSGQQYLWNDIKNFRQKWLVKKSKIVWRKKTIPSPNIPSEQKELRKFDVKLQSIRNNI